MIQRVVSGSFRGVFGVLLVAVATGAVFQAAPGMVVYYAFDESAGPTAADGSGNGFNGTHFNVTVSTNAPPVPTGNPRSLMFSPGAASYVEAPDNAAYTFTGPFTLAAWIYPTANYAAYGNPNNRGAIIRKWVWVPTPGTINGVGMDRLEDGRILMFNGTAAGYVSPTTTGTAPLNQWTHVAAVYDGTNNRIYLNGVQDYAAAYSTNPGSNIGELRIGRDDWTRYFYGNIDEVRLFDRALSAGEIAVLHGGMAAPTGLVASPAIESVNLSWTAVSGATSYTVFQSTTSGSGYAQIGTTPTTSFTATNIYFPTRYYFVVVANGIMTSGYSNEANAVPDNNLPRFDDAEEGARDRECGCGAADGASALLACGLAALLLVGSLAFRR